MRRLIAAGALAGLLCTNPAVAAVLSGVSGQVLVNSGHGYAPATEGMQLKPGDSVIANPGAKAEVAYEGCSAVAVQPGDVVTVLEDVHACAALGAAAGAAGVAGGVGASALVVGGLAVAGVVGVVATASNSRDRPASP